MTNLKFSEEFWRDLTMEHQRETRKRSLLAFTQYTFPRYIADPAHAFIASHLDAMVRDELKRLMIFTPPQHGKSELVSVRLPAFWLGNRPDDPVIISSYGASLAHSKSRQARNVVESQEFSSLFPDIRTDPASRSRNEWSLESPSRGAVVAAGVGGPITGHGAALGICDDPLESWEQAQSERIRDKIWDWWKGTFRTRIWENGGIVLIMTRWHESDLAGRLLQEQGERWTVLRLPALAETQKDRDFLNERMNLPTGGPDLIGREPGKPLCPSRFSVEALKETQTDVGPLVWGGLYQGAPMAPEGNRFKRGHFRIVDASPAKIRQRVRYWDLASTEGAGARSAGTLLGIDDDSIIYIEDVVYGQWDEGQRNKTMLVTAELDHQKYSNRGKMWIEQEPGSSGKDAVNALIKYLAGFVVQADRVTGAKDVRLEPFVAQAIAGNVRLVRGSWNGAYITEMCSVPSGKYRDMADATAGAYNKVARGGILIG